MPNIIVLVVLIISILKNIFDRKKEADNIKLFVGEFDSYQKDCEKSTAELKSMFTKLEKETLDYKEFVEGAVSDIAKDLDSLNLIVNNIVLANKNVLAKATIIDDIIKSNALALEDSRVKELLQIMQLDISNIDMAAKQAKKLMLNQHRRFEHSEQEYEL